MNILVILRMVPDPTGEMQISDDGTSLDREWLDFQLNDFDDHALEEAVLLKEASGGRVIAACLGEGANRTLQMAAAKGADELIAIDAGHDGMIASRHIAHTIAELARLKSADLVLSGVQSSEDLLGQLVPYLGGLMGWPHVSGTSHVSAGTKELTVIQERGGGVAATWSVSLPAILGIQTASKSPRYVSGSKLREAAKTPISTHKASTSGFSRNAVVGKLDIVTGGATAEDLGGVADDVADKLMRILSGRGLFTGVA